MSSKSTERNAAKIVAVLDGLDRTFGELQRSTDLGEHECERAVNYLKAQGRIENRQGLLHLRPAATEESSDAPAEADAGAPGEPIAAAPTEETETLVFEGWTLYMTYSHLLPPLTPEEYADLKADIEQHGMMVPVLLSQTGQDRHYHVLDGQHRLRIAAELGLKWMDFPKTYRNLLTPEEREELALNLNLHRRHLTPEQRRDWALKFRQQGMSYRAIGDKLGVDKETVRADVKAATVENSTVELPDRVTGLDGKERPATQPKPAPADDPHNPEADKASLRILLGLADGSLHRMVLVRQALDAGLTNAQVMGALQALIAAGEIRMDGLICVLVPAETATPVPPPPTLDARATIRVLLAGEPVKRADLWRQFALNTHTPDLYDVLREMVLSGEVIVSDVGGTYTLATAAPAAGDSAPGETVSDAPAPEPRRDTSATRGLPMPVEAAKGLIVDALRGSQRWLTEGELQKYANIRPEHGGIFGQALRALIDNHVVRAIIHDGRTLYHFTEFPLPDDAQPIRIVGDQLFPMVVTPMLEQRQLVESLEALRFAAKQVRKLTVLSAWNVLERTRLDETHELLKQTHDDLTGLQDHLAALGAQIKLALPENQAPGVSPFAKTVSESPDK
jgi:ParB-like chromosome segregation protein Spo0J